MCFVVTNCFSHSETCPDSSRSSSFLVKHSIKYNLFVFTFICVLSIIYLYSRRPNYYANLDYIH